MFTSIQDAGRQGMEAFGIPESGFLDQSSGKLANQLVGNSPAAALLEITGTGPTLRFLDKASIALTGGDFSATLNDVPIEMNTVIHIKKDSVLKLKQALTGFRTYLAFKGKLEADNVYDSYSTNFQGGFGGYKGRKLKKGDELKISNQLASVKTKKLAPSIILNGIKEYLIKIFPGPEFNLLSEKQKSQFTSNDFTVSSNSNRMGYRLSGDWTSSLLKLDTIISSGNVRGVVQLPPSLAPIILMNDAGTTGGYPRIGICANPDLIAQIKPGDKIRFDWI